VLLLLLGGEHSIISEDPLVRRLGGVVPLEPWPSPAPAQERLEIDGDDLMEHEVLASRGRYTRPGRNIVGTSNWDIGCNCGKR
jgi:hypothetical protein